MEIVKQIVRKVVGSLWATALLAAVYAAVTAWQDHLAVRALIAAVADDTRGSDGKTRLTAAEAIVEDHKIVHALAVREGQRIQAERQQQALARPPAPPNVTIPITPPVASSPVPPPKPAK